MPLVNLFIQQIKLLIRNVLLRRMLLNERHSKVSNVI